MSKAKQKPAAKSVKITIGKPKAKKAAAAPAKSSSKQATIIAMLKRPKGATLDELMKATGWQRHSVHGVMSGVLKKRLGLKVVAESGDHGRSYRIADAR